MTKEQWTIDEYLKELPSEFLSRVIIEGISLNMGFHVAISTKEISQHAKALLEDARLRILVSGNVYKDVGLGVSISE